MTESRFPPNGELLKRAFADYFERKTLCRAPGCNWGYVAPDPDDIDTFTEAPRTEHCPVCKGHGFVDRQQELPF